MKKILNLAILVIFASTYSFAQLTTITNLSKSYQNHFGWDLSGYGNYCCVSDPRDSINDYGNGSVYIYEKSGSNWNFSQRISSKQKVPYQLFGYRVSMYQDYLAVTEIGNQTKGFMSGKVYIYHLQNNVWSLSDSLLPDTSQKMALYGEALQLYGNTLYVGAPNIDSGCVYIYQNQGGKFTLKQKIISPYNTDYEFGKTICVSPDYLFIGAPATNNSIVNGGVFVYKMKNQVWELDTFFRQQISLAGSHFGASLAFENNNLIIGAPFSTVSNGTDEYFFAGAVYVASIVNNAWTLNSNPITSKDIGGHDLFGSSIALKDSILFVSSPRHDKLTKDEGSIETFKLNNNNQWIADSVYYAPNHSIYFGNNIFVFNDNLMVSTGGEKTQKNKGLIYIFQINNLLDNIQNPANTSTQYRILPNPTSEYFSVQADTREPFIYNIYSIDGRLMLSGAGSVNKRISVKSLSNGIYMISIQDKNQNVHTERLVVSH